MFGAKIENLQGYRSRQAQVLPSWSTQKTRATGYSQSRLPQRVWPSFEALTASLGLSTIAGSILMALFPKKALWSGQKISFGPSCRIKCKKVNILYQMNNL